VKYMLGRIKTNLMWSHPLIEGVLLERKDGYTITLTNFSMQKQKNVVVEFIPPEHSKIKNIFSPYGRIEVSKKGEGFTIRIPEIDKFYCLVAE
ncbi:MAG: hypothetical protein N2115_01770, partial [bacterium]|nr:hypothetical protein [bacterium]